MRRGEGRGGKREGRRARGEGGRVLRGLDTRLLELLIVALDTAILPTSSSGEVCSCTNNEFSPSSGVSE
jgi:hypothetical protein